MRRRMRAGLAAVTALWLAGCANRCVVRGNEKADLYPTYAYLNADKTAWNVPIHGRIYEPKNTELSRATMLILRTVMSIPNKDVQSHVFEERARAFMVN